MCFCIKKLEVVTKDLRQQYEKAVYVSLLLVTDGPIPKERLYQWREKKKRNVHVKVVSLGDICYVIDVRQSTNAIILALDTIRNFMNEDNNTEKMKFIIRSDEDTTSIRCYQFSRCYEVHF